MLLRPKNRKSYSVFLNKVGGRHARRNITLPPFIWIELNGNEIKMLNIFSKGYDIFEDGKDVYVLDNDTLALLQKRINSDLDEVGLVY